MLVWKCAPFAPSDYAVKTIRRYKAQHPSLVLWLNKDTFVCTATATRLQDRPFTKWLKEHKALLDITRLIEQINERAKLQH
jgi:hypothetical protein